MCESVSVDYTFTVSGVRDDGTTYETTAKTCTPNGLDFAEDRVRRCTPSVIPGRVWRVILTGRRHWCLLGNECPEWRQAV